MPFRNETKLQRQTRTFRQKNGLDDLVPGLTSCLKCGEKFESACIKRHRICNACKYGNSRGLGVLDVYKQTGE